MYSMGTDPFAGMDIEDITRAFLEDTSIWPNWPLLPLKRPSSDFIDTGVLVAPDLTTVYMTNIFMMPESRADLDKMEKIRYKDADDIIHDNWVVD